ncbi:MAG: hypothetical protein DWQ44_00130 [Bacteroidetes bacterium]|nr:MAG: hypothetical protein DWQ33_05080 [Bacteroidota bacterium]REK06037.1 MAG: hypothetical protein DWQ39_04220 [Bacteroidota bacterium]REK37095.1 MAG: hypothetical protein DWQ44_00130 [Bacteroidota bacterium]REK47512.1 MAG: hypothetical protein DWQ48_12315 [Bacteroidota bacterium]
MDDIIRNVKEIADLVNASSPAVNEFYTINKLMNFRYFPVIPNIADSISKIIEGIQPYASNGKVIWVTLSEKLEI